jgi:hypothetical protein
MFLVNWFQANALMIVMSLILIGIPAVILYITFSKKSAIDADIETYLKDNEEGTE